jgi:hypothetical protein
MPGVPTNPVGAEYIIMEKACGTELAERWGTMNALERYKIIDGIVKTETELEGMKLPAFGSLFRGILCQRNIHVNFVLESRPNWPHLRWTFKQSSSMS